MGRRRQDPNPGFLFVSEQPCGLQKQDQGVRRAIRNHVMRGKNVGPRGKRDSSSPETEDEPSKSVPLVIAPRAEKIPIPRSANIFTFMQLTGGVDARGKSMIFDFYTSIAKTLFPLDVCCCVAEVDSYKLSWLTTDAAYVNSVAYASSLFQDISARRAPVQRTQYHALKTMRELQHRVADASLALEDSTVTVVVTMASAAQHGRNEDVAETHLKGLFRIVDLRGGISSFDRNCRLQTKLHRVDLHRCLSTGCPPQFDEDIYTRAFSPYVPLASASKMMRDLSSGLQCILGDFQDLVRSLSSVITNDVTIEADHYTRTVASVQYRLLAVRYADTLSEITRLASLAFLITMTTTVPGYRTKLTRFEEDIATVLQNGEEEGLSEHPTFAWAVVVIFISTLKVEENYKWRDYASTAVDRLGKTWEAVHEKLDSFLWISAIHNPELRRLMYQVC